MLCIIVANIFKCVMKIWVWMLACPSAKHASYLYTAYFKVHDLFNSDFGNITLFCIPGSSSVLSALLQKLSERLTTAIGGGMVWITREFGPLWRSTMV